MTENEEILKLAKYLCRSYDNRWSSSRTWEDIPDDIRQEWIEEAVTILQILKDKTSEDFKDPYYPIGYLRLA